MKQLAVTLLQLPDGRYVFQRRTHDAPVNAGLVGFFGGHIEDGEVPEAGARRELKEETSLDVDSLTFKPQSNFVVDREGEDVEYHVFEVAIKAMDFDVFEGEHAEAYDIASALERDDLTSSVKYVLERLMEEG